MADNVANPFADMPPPAAPPSTPGASADPFADMPAPPVTNGQPGESAFTSWMNQHAPSFLQPANVHEASNLASRAFIRSNPAVGLANTGVVLGQEGLDLVGRKTGLISPDAPPSQPFNPLESTIDAAGGGMSPDASAATKTADAVAPWLRLSPSQGARVAEAGGAFNKLMTGARSEAGNLADWVASDQAQQWAADHHLGPLAQTIAGMVGGTGRNVATRAATPVLRKVIGAKPDAGETFDVNQKLSPAPGATVPPVPTFRDVADPTSSIARFISGAGAIPFSGTGEAGAVKAQTKAIGGTADEALSQLSPGTTSVFDAGPKTANAMGSRLANQSRDAIMNQEQGLIEKSNALDSQIGVGTKVDAAPLRNEVARIADPNNLDVNETVRAQARKVLDDLDKSIDKNGQITYGALKTSRTTFGQYLDSLATNSTGESNIKPTLSKELGTIKDSLTERMQEAANSKGVGPEWSQNDAGWTLQGEMKRNLASIGGELSPDRTKFATAPGGKQVRKVVGKAVEGEGGEGVAPIRQIEEGLDEQPARSAVAETIAAYGRPKASDSTQKFRPATFGEGVQSKVDPDVKEWIEEKAGPQARQKLDTAAEAGARTSEPREQGGFRNAIGSIAGAAPYVGAAGSVAGFPALALSPLVTMLTSASHDPDLIRTIANRNRPIADLAPQLAAHAGMGGAAPGAIDPRQLLQQGAGAIGHGAAAIPGLAATMMKYLSGGAQR